jgi:prevent-host-death family protein
MKTVSIRDIKERFDELVRAVEQGETVTVTRDGKPVFNLVPSEEKPAEKTDENKGGVNWEAGQAYLRARGITNPVPYISDDFDDPLPEDFLITPLPER